MATVIQNFIYMAFNRHIKCGHNADFEVCADEICRQAVEMEDAVDFECVLNIIKSSLMRTIPIKETNK